MVSNIAVVIGYAALCMGGYILAEKRKDIEIKNPKAVMLAVTALSFLLRLWLALTNEGFKVDINCFKAWAEATAYYGLGEMYHSGMFIDYPPGYMYVLRFLKLIQSVFSIPYDSALYTCIIKMPALLADMGCVWFVYRLASEKHSEREGVIWGSLMALCPATIFVSAIWGQVDSLFIFILVLSLYAAYKDDTVKAALLYALALLVKPQALLFGPVFLFYIIQRKDWKEFFKAVGIGISALYLLTLPFANTLSPLWLIELYANTLSGYKYFTVNGYNLYMLMEYNWRPLSWHPMSDLINPVVIGICFMLCAFGWAKIRDKSKFFTSSLVFIMVFFAFCTMMHERYLFPALILSIVSYILTKNNGYLALHFAVSTATLLNVVMSFASQEIGYTITAPMYKGVSLLVVLCCVATLFFYVKQLVKSEKLTLPAKTIELVAVSTLTVCYAFFAFFRLGSFDSPQTFYQSASAGDWFTLTFREPVNVRKVAMYSGMGDRRYPDNGYYNKIGSGFEVLYSDGVQWHNAVEINHDYVFTWKVRDTDFTTSYVQVRAKNANAILNEVIFTDSDGNPIPCTVREVATKDNPYSAHFAVDEQDTLPENEGYYWSMYFDEIYHARTAYEQLHGYPIYETTHPPLGKILISTGVMLLGMNPFGWRFMGTLSGVITVVIMYLLAKELLKKEKIAFLCAFIFAFDFMHYTQTRIATVDSFLVMFVMLMFLYMLKYARIPLEENRKQQNICLLLSGVFMGCAVAVKWNGAYGAAGLAVFFFVNLWLKYRDFTQKGDTKQGQKLAFTTCLWCVLFFVVIPFAIYFVSFIPVFRNETFAGDIQEFIRYQVNMYDYHSKLESEHFFSSMWYTWPLIIKPIWYSATRFGNMVSSISAFGNPAVWLPMVPCLVLMCLSAYRKKDRAALPVIIGYLGCYTPWVLVTRLAFIYHYFPATVFGVLAIGYMAKAFDSKSVVKAVADQPDGEEAESTKVKKDNKNLIFALYSLIVVLLFLIYFPVISGVPAGQSYVDSLELLGSWYFN